MVHTVQSQSDPYPPEDEQILRRFVVSDRFVYESVGWDSVATGSSKFSVGSKAQPTARTVASAKTANKTRGKPAGRNRPYKRRLFGDFFNDLLAQERATR